MQGRQAQPTKRLAVLGRAIASMTFQAIARVRRRELMDQSIARLLG
jgi:hypothetical protein